MSDFHDIDALRARAEEEGQGHLFRFWAELDTQARARLADQVASLDWSLLRRLRGLLKAPPAAAAGTFEPPDTIHAEGPDRAVLEPAIELGNQLLAQARVGYVLVAGGQGSRLGFEGPKGKFPVGPLTDRSLFHWHAARLAAASARHATPIHWYVMTSQTNDAETRAYFAENEHFGLGEESVFFFQQNMLPALDTEGRVMLEEKGCLFLAPNGHGGTLDALRSSGALAHSAQHGVETFSYFQVDNPLARPADPLFLGLHTAAQAQMSSKVVRKREPGEKVGVIGRVDGVLGCIEYSDLPSELQDARAADGSLLFNAGNIAAHILERAFVEELTRTGLDLPWHLARKTLRVVGENGELEERAGVKFETFVFDALGRTRSSVTLEVDRALEFSPVKNKDGADSPETCRADLSRLFASWLDGDVPRGGRWAACDRGRSVLRRGRAGVPGAHAARARPRCGRIPLPMNTQPIPVAIVGARGRLGRFARELLERTGDLCVAAEVVRGDDLGGALNASGAQVALDVTRAGRGAAHARVMLEQGVRPVIGTSGVDPGEDPALDALARAQGIGGLVVPNFSIGIWLQQQFACKAAGLLRSIEIVEEHHADKVDAPSGTALDTARQLEALTGAEPGSIPIHALRLVGLYANQSVLLGGPGEVLRLEHQTFGLEAYGPGILASLRYAVRAVGFGRGLGLALESS